MEAGTAVVGAEPDPGQVVDDIDLAPHVGADETLVVDLKEANESLEKKALPFPFGHNSKVGNANIQCPGLAGAHLNRDQIESCLLSVPGI